MKETKVNFALGDGVRIKRHFRHKICANSLKVRYKLRTPSKLRNYFFMLFVFSAQVGGSVLVVPSAYHQNQINGECQS